MTISHQKFREVTLYLLFSHDFHESEDCEIEKLVIRELKVSRQSIKKAKEKVQEVLEHLPAIDPLIRKTSISYDFDRIQRVERAIIRLIAYELLYEKKLDIKILIAEAKRLAKKFSTPEAAVFCQAILDAIAKNNV